VSQTLCAGTFVSGLDPDALYDDALRPDPGQKILAKRLRYVVDRNNREVRTTWAGMFASRSVFRAGFGCTVLRGSQTADGLPKMSAALRREIAEARSRAEGHDSFVAAPQNPKLEAALDQAFAEPAQPPFRRTRAIVILRDGQIIAERYAPRYSVDTPVLGYSLSKSVISALVGILVREGKLSVEQPAPVAAWSDPSDPRHKITINQLLRMSSGLAIEEADNGFDPVSRMLFVEPDMAAFAEHAKLKAAPGSQWEYTSGNTLILSRIVRDAVGGSAEDVVRFAQRELFEPLGMTTATLQFDATGTPVGSTSMLASARDWARFGNLYLNDGVVGGKRILPEGWVTYSAAPTLNTPYGAGFWTNRGAHGDAAERIAAGMPADAFFGSGVLGQRVVVIPSEHLVIVRMGFAHGPGFDIRGLLRLISDTTAALKAPQ
jgi:CubicO group peptidase (beta-lactamase class C family)